MPIPEILAVAAEKLNELKEVVSELVEKAFQEIQIAGPEKTKPIDDYILESHNTAKREQFKDIIVDIIDSDVDDVDIDISSMRKSLATRIIEKINPSDFGITYTEKAIEFSEKDIVDIMNRIDKDKRFFRNPPDWLPEPREHPFPVPPERPSPIPPYPEPPIIFCEDRIKEVTEIVKNKLAEMREKLETNKIENVYKNLLNNVDEIDSQTIKTAIELVSTELEDVEPILRDLTEEEINEIAKQTGIKESVFEGAKIDEHGKIYLKCDNAALEGLQHEITGVKFVRKEIEINGVKIEVVVPEFDSIFDTMLSPEAIESGDESVHLLECINNLREALKTNPELRAKFTEKELKMIEESEDGRIKGYTWHHDVETGKMQLVRTLEHSKTGHIGGMALWGGGYKNK